jgi:hypothetical protein
MSGNLPIYTLTTAPEKFAAILDHLLADADFIDDLARLAGKPKIQAAIDISVACLNAELSRLKAENTALRAEARELRAQLRGERAEVSAPPPGDGLDILEFLRRAPATETGS